MPLKIALLQYVLAPLYEIIAPWEILDSQLTPNSWLKSQSNE